MSLTLKDTFGDLFCLVSTDNSVPGKRKLKVEAEVNKIV